MEVTTGQRKYGGPPPNWEGPPPGAGHEVRTRLCRNFVANQTLPYYSLSEITL